MLFNSTLFLLAFLPVTVGVFFALGRTGRTGFGLGWLVFASLVFYAWEDPAWIGLLVLSIAANYGFGVAIARARGTPLGRLLLALGVALDLALLGWFKYRGFGAESLVWLGVLPPASGVGLSDVAIPLAISFYTFQQIAYLVETWQGEVRETRFAHYVLFVAFFPKLVAGPIVHHGEIMEQLDAAPTRRFDPSDLAVGVTLIAFGLFKKVVLADGVAARANPLFAAADLGLDLTFLEAWVAAIAYTLQVYFDFSGYSDMAIGAARCFGVVLPLNFHSPYRATNISEFWRRWHVTLTRWLRLYLFVPISRGLLRRGEAWEVPAVVVAQLVTMLLCGLWHGAGVTFVVWGGLHGLLLLGHDAWTGVKGRLSLAGAVPAPVGAWSGRVLLFLVLAATFVVFRAADLEAAGRMLAAMSLANGVALPAEWAALAAPLGEWLPGAIDVSERVGLHAGGVAWLHLAALLAIVWALPNSQEVLADHRPVLDLRRFARAGERARVRWRPSLPWAVAVVALLGWSFYELLVTGYEPFVYRFF